MRSFGITFYYITENMLIKIGDFESVCTYRLYGMDLCTYILFWILGLKLVLIK